MAKVPFTKLKCKINTNIVPFQIGEETISIKQYLPIQEKLKLIGRVIMYAHEEDKNYANPLKVKVITDMELVYAYTDISFTIKQRDETDKTYDLLYSSGLLNLILEAIPQDEKDLIYAGIQKTIDSIYTYQNSAVGIMDAISNNYNEASFDVDKIQNTIKELSTSPIIQEVLPLLGADN